MDTPISQHTSLTLAQAALDAAGVLVVQQYPVACEGKDFEPGFSRLPQVTLTIHQHQGQGTILSGLDLAVSRCRHIQLPALGNRQKYLLEAVAVFTDGLPHVNNPATG